MLRFLCSAKLCKWEFHDSPISSARFTNLASAKRGRLNAKFTAHHRISAAFLVFYLLSMPIYTLQFHCNRQFFFQPWIYRDAHLCNWIIRRDGKFMGFSLMSRQYGINIWSRAMMIHKLLTTSLKLLWVVLSIFELLKGFLIEMHFRLTFLMRMPKFSLPKSAGSINGDECNVNGEISLTQYSFHRKRSE